MSVLSAPFETQTAPSPTATWVGSAPAALVMDSWSVFGSMRETVWSSWLVTQTAPSPTATELGREPTLIVAASRFVAGSIRWRESTFGVSVGFVLGLPA